MTLVEDLVREELQDLADSCPPPSGVADRVIARDLRRRHVRLAATVTAAVLVTFVASTLPVRLWAGSGSRLAARGNERSVVYAMHRGVWDEVGRRPWQVLDPRTGSYRDVDVSTVSAPTADLRYAAVTPSFVYEAGQMPGPRPGKIGRYESSTGNIRWYDVPASPLSDAWISSDGRYEVAFASAEPAQMIVLDLSTGHATVVAIDPAALPAGADLSLPSLTLTWRPDSRHVMLLNQILDLHGRRVGELAKPAGSTVIGVRPGGSGLLLHPVGQFDTFAVTNAAGAIIGSITPACMLVTASPITASPMSSLPATTGSTALTWQLPCHEDFVGWRGPDEILLSPAGALGERIDSVNLFSGEDHTVYHIGGTPRLDTLVIVPAAGISEAARKAGF